MAQGMQPDDYSDYASAVRLYQAGDAAKARTVCEQLLARDPGDRQTRKLLAVLLFNQGDGAAAIGHMDQVLAAAPDDTDTHYTLAQMLDSLDQPDRAIGHLEQVIRLDPANPGAYLGLAQIHLKGQETSRAADCLRQGLTILPDNATLLAELGSILATLDQAAEAIEILRRAVSLNTDEPAIHYNLAKVLAENGQTGEAVRHYESALGLRPDFDVARNNLANLLARVGRTEDARRHCEMAVELNPDSDSAWQNLGSLLLTLGATEQAAEAYAKAFAIRRKPGGPKHIPEQFETVSRSKLEHDIEQLRYLIGRGALPPEDQDLVAAYEAELALIPTEAPRTGRRSISSWGKVTLAASYNRAIHVDAGRAIDGAAVNPDLDWAAVAADYARNAPGYTHLDGLLVPQALDGLRRFCLDSTIWYEFRYPHGYLGAFMTDGFCCPLLLQIAEELRQALPDIFRDHTLRKLWAFKYDSQLTGIPVHADFAAVNVNFWITPDEANLDPDSGGLVFYDKEAPLDWDFALYNENQPAIHRFLEESGAKKVNVPHRQNRAVVFNSDLFHETGEIKFRDGYENRRINITMLFGDRAGA